MSLTDTHRETHTCLLPSLHKRHRLVTSGLNWALCGQPSEGYLSENGWKGMEVCDWLDAGGLTNQIPITNSGKCCFVASPLCFILRQSTDWPFFPGCYLYQWTPEASSLNLKFFKKRKTQCFELGVHTIEFFCACPLFRTNTDAF